MEPIQLHPLALGDLKVLHMQKVQAETVLTQTMNAMLLALGLDPRLDHHVDLDTGLIHPAGPKPDIPKADTKEK